MTRRVIFAQAGVVIRKRGQKASDDRRGSRKPEASAPQLDGTAREQVIDGVFGELHRYHRDQAHAGGRLGRRFPRQLIAAAVEEDRFQGHRRRDSCRHWRENKETWSA